MNEAAEAAILGSALIERFGVQQAQMILEPGDFLIEKNRSVYRSMLNLLAMQPEGGIDTVTVAAQLKRDGQLEFVGGAGYLTDLVNQVATAAHAEYYAKIVKQESIEQQIGVQLSATSQDRTPENVKKLGDLIMALQGCRGVSLFDMRKDLGPMVEQIFDQPDPGFRTGMDGIDGCMKSLHRGDLWTIGARPGGGKTALMLKLFGTMAARFAAEAAEKGIEPPCLLYITTEMRTLELVQRLLPMATGISHAKFRSARFSREDQARIFDCCEEMSQLPMKIACLPHPSLDDIRGVTYAAKPQVVFIDYLQRCRMPRAENMAYQIMEFYRGLKSFLLESQVTGFIGCQTDRDLDRMPTQAPMMSHLKGSGGIESESDGVALLWEPPPAVIEKRHDWIPPHENCTALELVFRKNRNGPKDVVADLELDGRLIKMCERYSEPQQGELK